MTMTINMIVIVSMITPLILFLGFKKTLRSTALLLMITSFSLSLSACGQKGALYLPEQGVNQSVNNEAQRVISTSTTQQNAKKTSNDSANISQLGDENDY